jgi:hypothetical protein
MEMRAARTMSALELVHAFHCTHAVCPDSVCAEAKAALRRVEVHSVGCRLRLEERDAADGTPAQCKMCRLWAALHRTRLVSSTACQPCVCSEGDSGPASPKAKQHDDIVGLQMTRSEGRLPPSRRAGWGGSCCSGVWFKAHQRLRPLGPAQVHHPLPRPRWPHGGRATPRIPRSRPISAATHGRSHPSAGTSAAPRALLRAR